MRGQKSDEGEFVTKLVGIKLDVHIKISQIPCKIFVAHIFFTDHLKLKAPNKTSCRTPSANTYQLCANYLKSFLTAMIIFRGFQDFLIYLPKYFKMQRDYNGYNYDTIFS